MADRLFMDETKAPVLDPGCGQTKKGYFCAIASDDRGTAVQVRRSCCSGMPPVAAVSLLSNSSTVLADATCNATLMTGMTG
ncbi:hypothetical protein [Bradyrhizobium sp. CCBAU 21359]|uniref:hypothetical protein n=1 Tax=Bradyrhizobium sp. CCBAU 21359 TaxID=1325080 RepID=UPI003FA48E07